MKIKKRKKFDVEKYRQSLLCAVDAMDPSCELYLDRLSGAVEINGDAIYPKEIVYYREIEKLIDKRNFYMSMSDDAKTIVNFICLADIRLVKKLCGTPVRGFITAHSVGKYFRGKWGKFRVDEAVKEIKKMLAI